MRKKTEQSIIFMTNMCAYTANSLINIYEKTNRNLNKIKIQKKQKYTELIILLHSKLSSI